jgi:hypothetical protein
MKKKIVYILHGLNNNIIDYFYNLNLKKTKLTFDDGLASIYKYKNFLKDMSKKNKIILFINPYFVTKADYFDINIEFIECFHAHKKAMKGNFENYLNTEMILELSQFCEIGLHGWDHFIKPISFKKNESRLKTLVDHYKKDIEKSWQWLSKTIPEYLIKKKIKFAWPYNKKIEIYEILQNKFYRKLDKIIEYYSSERISGWWNYYEKEKK